MMRIQIMNNTQCHPKRVEYIDESKSEKKNIYIKDLV